MTSPKPRILITDDHEDTREMIALVLKQSDYEVSGAANVVEALKLATSGKYNLFIFDSWLPDGTGIDLCRTVRTFDHQTPILFYSAVAYEQDKELAMSAGAQAYLVKPVELAELLQTVKELITHGLTWALPERKRQARSQRREDDYESLSAR